VPRLYLELETIQGQLRTTKPWFISGPWQNDWFYASIVGKLMPRMKWETSDAELCERRKAHGRNRFIAGRAKL
jgi:hypothetical protein